MIVAIKILIIGIGATLTMDIYTYILRFFGIKSLDYRFVGRWIGNITKGRFFHDDIRNTKVYPYELIIGWIAHYLIGIVFVFLLVFIYGKTWLVNPTIQPAIVIGLITVIAPFFLMQPSFGFGIAGSKLSNPTTARFKSLVTHFVYGIGMYLSAISLNKLLEFIQ